MSFLDYLFDDETAVSGLKTLTDSIKNKGSGSNNVWFRFRNGLDFNQSCTVRFLPASPENMAGPFWLPKKLVRLKFADPVNVGQDVNITVPVMQMYTGGKPADDLVLGQATRLYEQAKALDDKGETEKSKQVRAVASAHYIRGEAIAQCFVINPGFVESDPPENPIRLIELNKQIIKVITAKLETDHPETKLDFWPCHGRKGYNFIIKKNRTGDGKYAKWDDGGTGFSSKISPWTEEQKANADKYGLWDLTSFLPARPSEDEYKLLADIVRQSIQGDRVWNPDWEAHLSAVKVYRTTQAGDEDETATYSDQVQNVLNNLPTKPSTTADSVLSSLSRTASNHEAHPSADEAEPEVSDAETDEGKVAGAKSVSSLVDKLKRQQTKTATPND